MFTDATIKPASIRSFACRETRLSSSLVKAWEELWPKFGITEIQKRPLDLDTIFERPAKTLLDIGFGDGKSLCEMAAEAKDKNFLGIEVYRKGIARTLQKINDLQLTNIRILWGDAVSILTGLIPANSLGGIQIFFADPWPKTRHHKRRLIQQDFVEILADKLEKNGVLHLATDWEDYAHHMMSVISKNSKLQNLVGPFQFSARPEFRPFTKYEERGIVAGHVTKDLLFSKR